MPRLWISIHHLKEESPTSHRGGLQFPLLKVVLFAVVVPRRKWKRLWNFGGETGFSQLVQPLDKNDLHSALYQKSDSDALMRESGVSYGYEHITHMSSYFLNLVIWPVPLTSTDSNRYPIVSRTHYPPDSTERQTLSTKRQKFLNYKLQSPTRYSLSETQSYLIDWVIWFSMFVALFTLLTT